MRTSARTVFSKAFRPAPDLLGDLLDEYELGPLLRLGQLVPIPQLAKPHCELRHRRPLGGRGKPSGCLSQNGLHKSVCFIATDGMSCADNRDAYLGHKLFGVAGNIIINENHFTRKAGEPQPMLRHEPLQPLVLLR